MNNFPGNKKIIETGQNGNFFLVRMLSRLKLFFRLDHQAFMTAVKTGDITTSLRYIEAGYPLTIPDHPVYHCCRYAWV